MNTTPTLDHLDAIVVGGAIGGAAAALLLARAGARVTLLERVAQPRAVGAGIAIAENGLAVLESLGLGAALAPHARFVGTPRIVDGAGRELLRPPVPTPRVAMLRRSTLHTILLDALAAEPRITTRFGVEAVEARADGSLRAVTPDGELALRASLVVGADGVRSRIRESGRFDARLSRPGIPYVRALVEDDVARGEEAWTSAGLFGSFAVDGGTYLYASASSPECRAAIASKDLAALTRAWAEAYPASLAILSRVRSWDRLLVNHVLRVDCRRWHDGRLVLLGDAAHAMPPNLGQGGNSALVDAAVLLDELRRHASLDDALGAYERRRRPAVMKVARTSARLGALAEPGHPLRRWMRDNVLMPILDRFADADTSSMIMQEPPDLLRAIGRA